MLVSIDPEYPNLKRVTNAAQALRGGKLLAYPTDTNYGIGADPFQPKAVSALFSLTKRDPSKAVSLLCADLSMASQYGVISNRIFKVMKKVMPGPYTLIVPSTRLVPRIMNGKRHEVGIRISDHPVVQALLSGLGTPFVNVSARDSEGAYLFDPRDIDDVWGRRLEAVIDCGVIHPQESTVIDCVDDEPVLIREGLGDPAPFLG